MNKHHLITMLISACLFLFLIILIYTLYCYVFYNKNQVKKYTDNYNNKEYSFIYNNLDNNDIIDEKDFYLILYQTLDKETILKIYNQFYKEKITEEEFIKEYYYGDIEITNKEITFKTKGKTTYGTRKEYKYENIKIPKDNKYTTLGILKNINFITNNNTQIKFDSQELYGDCNNKCQIEGILGGNHLIYIQNENKEYIAFINIYDSNIDIDLTNEEILVQIGEKEKPIDEPKEELTIKSGIYHIKECYTKPNVYCATKNKSYIEINEDKSVYFHLYNGWEIATTEYWGTYTIENNFVIMNFIKHSYTAFDYDTRTYSTIESNTPSTHKYKVDGKYLIGDTYNIYYVGPKEVEE